ncbi:MAG: hypothetical protein WCK91_00730, partial [bacterium]
LSQKKCAVFGLTEQRATDRLSLLQGQITGASSVVNNLCPLVNELTSTTDDYTRNLTIQNCNDAKTNLARAQAALASANSDPSNKQCSVWETVTPGSAIRDKVSKTLNSPETQLELVRNINDALNYLFTALLSRFHNQGLSSLVTQPVSSVSGGASTANNITDSLGNPVSGSGNNNGYSPFDITTDLAAIIKTQVDYVSEATKALSISSNIMPALGELDYCIPGPNPDWEQIAGVNITLNDRAPEYLNSIEKNFGITSPMQTPGGSEYLGMAHSGLALTTGLSSTDNKISSENSIYQSDIATANANIAKLRDIKSQVDAIVSAAKSRRAADRAKNGLPPIDASCN